MIADTDRKQFEPYQLYLYDVSYYSGKMEMFLRYKEIPFTRIELDAAQGYDLLYRNTGVIKVPAIRTATGEWLKDTTPMLDWFEARYPESAIMPTDPVVHFISKLVEDYADEWLWRPAMVYRWWYDYRILGPWLARDILPSSRLPFWLKSRFLIRRQSRLFMEKDGITTTTRRQVEAIYRQNLDGLESILRDSPYLLGNRPSLVDFGYMGPMFRHFSIDPTPARIMRQQAPRVYAWVAGLWAARASRFDLTIALQDFTHPGWRPIFKDICRAYLPYLQANAEAWSQKKRTFDHETAGIVFRRLPVVHYRVWCREALQHQWDKLNPTAKQRVETTMGGAGCLAALTTGGRIDSGLSAHYTTLPMPKRERRPGWRGALTLKLKGTPWDLWKASDEG